MTIEEGRNYLERLQTRNQPTVADFRDYPLLNEPFATTSDADIKNAIFDSWMIDPGSKLTYTGWPGSKRKKMLHCILDAASTLAVDDGDEVLVDMIERFKFQSRIAD